MVEFSYISFGRSDMKKMYTVDEASRILGISKVQVRSHLRNNGKQKVSGVYLITEDELEELKNRQGRGRPSKKGRPRRTAMESETVKRLLGLVRTLGITKDSGDLCVYIDGTMVNFVQDECRIGSVFVCNGWDDYDRFMEDSGLKKHEDKVSVCGTLRTKRTAYILDYDCYDSIKAVQCINDKKALPLEPGKWSVLMMPATSIFVKTE